MPTVPVLEPIQETLPPPPDDEKLYEVVDGRYVELPPMSTRAGLVAARLVRRLGTFAEAQNLGEVVSEVLFGLAPQSRRMHRPDIAYVSFERWAQGRPVPDTDPWPVVPDLAVEVISPSDLAESTYKKVLEYLDAGVRLVWVIYPQLAWVHVYESRDRIRGLSAADVLDAEPVLPGFRLPLTELFRPAPEPPNGRQAKSEPDNSPS